MVAVIKNKGQKVKRTRGEENKDQEEKHVEELPSGSNPS